MVRLTRIYTRQGDKGMTRLVGGAKVAKTALRVEVFGTLDELNSFIGLIRVEARRAAVPELAAESEKTLCRIQNELFDIGALLATPPGAPTDGLRPLTAASVRALEQRMDAYQERLEPLNSFVLPGGGPLGAYAHVARTVCRRAERLLWRLHETEAVDTIVLQYINRLSDYLFVYARWAARLSGGEEYLWDIGTGGG